MKKNVGTLLFPAVARTIKRPFRSLVQPNKIWYSVATMKKIQKTLNFRIIIEQDEDGIFIASVPAIPGCHTQGTTYEETIKNVQEAIELCLEVARENKTYYDKIDWSEAEGDKNRFLGVTEIPIIFGLSS